MQINFLKIILYYIDCLVLCFHKFIKKEDIEVFLFKLNV